jgi:hypothetical protein
MDADMKSAYEFTLKLRGEVPGPHKIWPANPTLSRTIVPTGAYFQTESSLTKGEIEIVTSVINGHWGAAYSNYEHEKIGEELGHLPAGKVGALIAGLPTSFDDPRQQVVYEIVLLLPDLRVQDPQAEQDARCLPAEGVPGRGDTAADGVGARGIRRRQVRRVVMSASSSGSNGTR